MTILKHLRGGIVGPIASASQKIPNSKREPSGFWLFMQKFCVWLVVMFSIDSFFLLFKHRDLIVESSIRHENILFEKMLKKFLYHPYNGKLISSFRN